MAKRKLHKILFLVFLKLLLVSCSAYKENIDLSIKIPKPETDTWAAINLNIDKSPVINDNWWEIFNDVALDSTMQIFIKNNFDLKLAISSLKASKAISKIDGSDILPRINLSLLDGNALGIGSSIPSDMYGINLSSSWELDIWGKLLSKRFSSKKEYQAKEYDYNFLRLSIISQGVKMYYNIIEAKEQQGLAESSVNSFQEILNIVEIRYNQGVRSSLDYRLALSNLTVSKAVLEQKKIIIDNLTKQMEVMLGLYPSGTYVTIDKLPNILLPIPPNMPSFVIAKRPDIKASYNRLQSAKYKLDYAKKNMLPAINLTDNSGMLSSSLKNLFDGDFSIWNLGKSISLPIFQSGKIKANIELAKSIYDQAEIQYVYVILKAFSEIETKLANDRMLNAQLEALNEAYIQSNEAYTLALDRYNNGLSDLITVLDSQRKMFDTRGQMITVRNLIIQNRIDLLICLGGRYSET